MQVEITAISDIDYDEGRERLMVTFNSGDQYLYVGVPGEVSFAQAESKGGFFASEICGCYPYNRV